MDQSYLVKLEKYEGPLDLLLHLINQYEIDIYDIPLAKLTEQYMEYIHQMRYLELNIASEYLVMAATLLAIKSQMLLPQQKMLLETDDTYVDPRDELVQQLIEYKKFKEAAITFRDKETESKQIFTRPADLKDTRARPIVEKGDLSIYDMLGALNKMFQRKKWNEPLPRKVETNAFPIEDKMAEIIALLKSTPDGISFENLFIYPTRAHIVATFIALLELMKNNRIYCRQEQHLATIYVFLAKEKVDSDDI